MDRLAVLAVAWATIAAATTGGRCGEAPPAEGPKAEGTEKAFRKLIDANKVKEAWELLKAARMKKMAIPDALIQDFKAATVFAGGGVPLFQCGTDPRNTERRSYDVTIKWVEPGKLQFWARDRRQAKQLEAAVELPLDWEADMPESTWVKVKASWGAAGMKLFVDDKLVASNKDRIRPGMGHPGHYAALGLFAYGGRSGKFMKGVFGDYTSSEDGSAKGYFVLRRPGSYVLLGRKNGWKAEGFVEFTFKAMPYLTNDTKVALPGAEDAPETKPPPVDPADARKARELIARLGAADWSEREKAAKALTAMGSKIAPLLEEAATKSSDAEVRLRARKLLARIVAGSPPKVKVTGSLKPEVVTPK